MRVPHSNSARTRSRAGSAARPCRIARPAGQPRGQEERGRRDANARAAFTLLEVVLAVAIAIGVLLVVLTFYRQAADLRTQVLQETERLTAVRLLLDRLANDLRRARSDYEELEGLTGDATSLRFVLTQVLPASAWSREETDGPAGPQTDLRMVAYGVSTAREETNLVVTGLTRTEQPLVRLRARRETQPTSSASTADAPESPRSPEPLTDVVKYVRFRYWDGSAWLDSWNDVELPPGVEVSLALEALPEDAAPDEYPAGLFRRVIALPGHGVSEGGFTLWDFQDEMPAMPESTP